MTRFTALIAAFVAAASAGASPPPDGAGSAFELLGAAAITDEAAARAAWEADGNAPVMPSDTAETSTQDGSRAITPDDGGPVPSPGPRADVIAIARRHLGARRPVVGGRAFPGSDCAHFVRAIYSLRGIDLMTCPRHNPGGPGSGTGCIMAFNAAHGALGIRQPAPGDLVYFDNTHDKNRNGRWDDRLTHIGVVEEVLSDGTVRFLHMSGGRVKRSHLNLARPHEKGPGNSLNDYLRRAGRQGGAILAGELFVGFGRLRLPGDETGEETTEAEPSPAP